MTSPRYEGVLAYPVTPLSDDGTRLNLTAYSALLERLLEAGVRTVIPLGSAGEFAYLRESERNDLAAATVEIVKRRVPVIVGVSALTTQDAAGYARHADGAGADGVMVSFPTYYGLTAAEVRAHVEAIAEATPLPIVLYNNPFTSAVDLDVRLLEKLAEIPSVVAIKEATMDTNRISNIWNAFGDRFEVLGGGYEPYAYPALALGVRGWTSAMANLVPQQCTSLFETLVNERNLESARSQNNALLPLANLLIEFGLSKAVKAGLSLLGIDVGPTRAPLAKLDEENVARLRDALTRAGAFQENNVGERVRAV